MKRIVVLTIITVFLFCLCACGSKNEAAGNITDDGSKTESANIKESVIGIWEREYDTSDGKIKHIMKIFEGGTGEFYVEHLDTNESTNSFTSGTGWEITDDVLNFTYSKITNGYKLSDDGKQLISVKDSTVIFNKTE